MGLTQKVKCARYASLWIAVALAVVTLAVFCPVAGFQFINFDDPEFVTANPHVQAGLTTEGFKWVWSSVVAMNWHPITMLSHMLDCQLFGIKPWWPHLMNALLHAANAVLLFGLLKRMTGAVWRSGIVAALFALHPLHVESVAWVSERKDVLSTLFWFLTTWAYVRYAEGRKKFYVLSLGLFGLGLMCKPMLVTLPFTLLLLDYWPLKRRAVAEKIPFFAMSAAVCVVTMRVQKQGGVMMSLQDMPFGERLGNALVAYVRYIEMMFWPRNLAGLYPVKEGQWAWWVVALAALLLVAVSALVLAQWRRRPYLAAGWFWYLGTLVPVIGLVQVWVQSMADRYTYVPLIGLFMIVVWGGWEMAGKWRLEKFAPVATTAALGACAALTMHQEFFWKNSEAYNKRMIDVTPNNFLAHNDLGVVYAEANRPEEAITNFMAAIEEYPDFADAHNNLGNILARQKRYGEAIAHFQTAVRLHPTCTYLVNMATALQEANALAEAARTFEQAARLEPNRADIWTKLAFAYVRLNRMPEAERAFRELVRLEPANAEAVRWLGDALLAQNKPADAIPFYLTALKLDPSDFRTENNLARTLALQGRRGEAADHYRQALRINPNLPEAQKALSELGLPQSGNR